MSTEQFIPRHTWRAVALAGAATDVGLAFAYALTFALYAIVRSSWTIWRWTPPEVGVFAMLAANTASIVVAALASAALLAVVMAPIGMISALVMAWLLERWNPLHATGRAIQIGAATALALVTLGQLALSLSIGRSLFSLGVATYLFWFGLPTLLILIGGALFARWLNQRHLTTAQALTSPSRPALKGMNRTLEEI